MSGVLSEILERTRHSVAGRRERRPLPRLERQVESTTRSFHGAIAAPGPRFVLELKAASPSEGVLRDGYDPAVIAGGYAGPADAISVITAEHRFNGSLEHLTRARTATALPLLCKDFVLDPYQVIEARVHGADAVLLILAAVDDRTYRRCADAAAALGMDVLTEIHDEAELTRAVALDARIIGINNRDLRTLAVDLATTERLAPLVPPDRLVVAESGVRTRADVARLAPHAQAFLVGSALMRAADPGAAARALVYGRVKICGLTSAADARLAWESGATYGGMIFAEASPRRVDEPCAADIAGASPLPLAGVFVNDRFERITRIATRLGLAAVQLHGDETAEEVAGLRPALPRGCEIWKAHGVRQGVPIPTVEETGADRLVLDNGDAGCRGGSGQPFPWQRLRECGDMQRLVLAGGITPQNAADAARAGCWALDLCSGVEARPRLKDPERLRELFDTLRANP